MALASAPQEEIPLREQQVALAKQAEEQMKKKIEVGTAAPLDDTHTANAATCMNGTAPRSVH